MMITLETMIKSIEMTMKTKEIFKMIIIIMMEKSIMQAMIMSITDMMNKMNMIKMMNIKVIMQKMMKTMEMIK